MPRLSAQAPTDRGPPGLTWTLPRLVDVSDMMATFRQAHDSIRALEYYEFTERVDVNAMVEATVSRYDDLVYLKYD